MKTEYLVRWAFSSVQERDIDNGGGRDMKWTDIRERKINKTVKKGCLILVETLTVVMRYYGEDYI